LLFRADSRIRGYREPLKNLLIEFFKDSLVQISALVNLVGAVLAVLSMLSTERISPKTPEGPGFQISALLAASLPYSLTATQLNTVCLSIVGYDDRITFCLSLCIHYIAPRLAYDL